MSYEDAKKVVEIAQKPLNDVQIVLEGRRKVENHLVQMIVQLLDHVSGNKLEKLGELADHIKSDTFPKISSYNGDLRINTKLTQPNSLLEYLKLFM
jgi:hypothetical protein